MRNTFNLVITWVGISLLYSFILFIHGNTQALMQIKEMYLPMILVVAIIGLILDISEEV